MSKSEPIVKKYMSPQPYFIEESDTLEKARDLMSKHQVRHLPVMKQGKVFGIVSDRDIKMACSIIGSDPSKMKVADMCHEHPFVTHPETLLHEAAAEMAEKRYGSAIVVQNGELVGILTTVDICRALAEVLQTRFH